MLALTLDWLGLGRFTRGLEIFTAGIGRIGTYSEETNPFLDEEPQVTGRHVRRRLVVRAKHVRHVAVRYRWRWRPRGRSSCASQRIARPRPVAGVPWLGGDPVVGASTLLVTTHLDCEAEPAAERKLQCESSSSNTFQ